MKRIILIPFGSTEPELLSQLRQSLKETFNCNIDLGFSLEQPHHAYDSQRGQYLAPAILNALSTFKGLGKVLGIVDVDLYTPELNFIFGQADIDRGLSVISLKRLRQEYYGLPPDKVLFAQRAIKEAVHELGHVYGLKHCPDKFCVMHFSNSLTDTDRKRDKFCPRCQEELNKWRI